MPRGRLSAADSYDPEKPALFDDAATILRLWQEALEAVARDETVEATTLTTEIVVVDGSESGDWPGQPTTLAYMPLTNTVEIQRRAMRGASALSGMDLVADPRNLKLALIHEAVHAYDHTTSPALTAAMRSESPRRRHAADLVAEGHAEFVTERVAESLGLTDEWRRRQRAIRRMQRAAGTDSDEALQVYDDGHEAMRRAFARGGADAVRELVLSPPEDAIELIGE